MLTLLLGTAGTLFFSLPFEQAKNIADSFSRDGSLESFTLANFDKLGIPIRVVGALLIAAGLALLLMPMRTRRWIEWLLRFTDMQSQAMDKDARQFCQALKRNRPGKWALAAMLIVTLIAAGVRWASIGRAMGHDEAYTFEAFASRSLDKVLTDYHLPNNHVFHTILVHFSYQVFGDAPWAVRFPAFLAGVLLVPAVYLVGKRMFSWSVGFLAAGMVAVAPVMVSYSTNARGYSLLALITLLSWVMGLYVKNHKNRFAWLLLSLLWALGFYTLPIMLYPFGMLWLWLLLSAFAKDISGEYAAPWKMVKYLLCFGGAAAILAILFYSPIFITSGIATFTNNTFVQSLSFSDFWQTLPHRLEDTWLEWNEGFPNLGMLLMAGFALSLVFHQQISRHKIPMPAVAFFWLVAVLIIQRPNPWAKIWVFLFPLMCLWACAGWLGLIQRIRLPFWRERNLAEILAIGLGVVLLVSSMVTAVRNLPETTAIKEVEKSAIYLSDKVTEGDVIAIDYPWDVTFWYYARRHGIPRQYYLEYKNLAYHHVFIVVSGGAQTALSVLKSRAKDGITCATGTIHVLQKIDNTLIYDCEK